MQTLETDVRHGARITAQRLKNVLAAFRTLEAMRGENEMCSVPLVVVKLEALHDDGRTMDERAFRLRVSGVGLGSGNAMTDRIAWEQVLQVAGNHDLEVRLDNGAMLLE